MSLDAASRRVTFSNPCLRIDAGGLAKGFALREISRLLDRCGYNNFLITSGDILGKGRRGDGQPWQIGIQHPRANRGQLLAQVALDSGCIFTSGDYERYYLVDGRRVHHIFNPYTGYSCTGNQSVTIWAANPLEAKALSTGLFGWSMDSILAFVEQRPRLECIVVDSAGAVRCSPGWANKIIWSNL
jgi:thiamine biosynthesis lipoprotein